MFSKNAGQGSPLIRSGPGGIDALGDMVPVTYIALPLQPATYLLFAKAEIYNADSSPQGCQLAIWVQKDSAQNIPPSPSTANIIEMAAIPLGAAGNVGCQTCINLIGKHTVTLTEDSNYVYLGGSIYPA